MNDRPIKHWLQLLPDGYRELALANYNEHFVRVHGSDRKSCMPEAVHYAFGWAGTPEGASFWHAVEQHYEHRENPVYTIYAPLPPLPEP